MEKGGKGEKKGGKKNRVKMRGRKNNLNKGKWGKWFFFIFAISVKIYVHISSVFFLIFTKFRKCILGRFLIMCWCPKRWHVLYFATAFTIFDVDVVAYFSILYSKTWNRYTKCPGAFWCKSPHQFNNGKSLHCVLVSFSISIRSCSLCCVDVVTKFVH